MTVTEEIISMQERKKNPDKPAKFKKKKKKKEGSGISLGL